MLLAECFVRHFLGRDWRFYRDAGDSLSRKKSSGAKSNCSDSSGGGSSSIIATPSSKQARELPHMYRQIAHWMHDEMNSQCPYSIHAVTSKGQKDGKAIGDWFGPSTISTVLAALLNEHSPDGMKALVCPDATIYLDQVEELCRDKVSQSRTEWHPLLLLVPTRLGMEKLNPIYFHGILSTFRLPQSLGFIGGKPSRAFYFVAAQGETLFYLDPHSTHPYVPWDASLGSQLELYHCASPCSILVSLLDPTVAFGFYCKDEADFRDLCDRLKHQGPRASENPVIHVADHTPDYSNLDLQDFELPTSDHE